jgi:UDP-2,4-diacetamido-2,4,6-trideoxy-beta-L-altropyranose hydrolase
MFNKNFFDALFIADAGPKIGWGHFIRSRALAQEFIAVGAKVLFYVRGEIPPISQAEIEHLSLEEDLDVFLKEAFAPVHILVLDLYEFTAENLQSLALYPISVCIDDGSKGQFTSDILINPNINEEFIHSFSPRTKYLAGKKYILLRPQFDNFAKRICKEKPENLMIAYGGTDPGALTPQTIHFLREQGENMPFQKVTVMIGKAINPEVIQASIAGDPRFHILQGVEDVSSLLLEADVGIFSAGTILYEAAASGLPSLIFSLNNFQAREARAFAANGAAYYLGKAENPIEDHLGEALNHLAKREVRQGMADKAQNLIDCQGRKRVTDAIWQLNREKQLEELKSN